MHNIERKATKKEDSKKIQKREYCDLYSKW